MTEIERIDIDNLVIDSAQSRSQQSWGSDESDQQLVESIAEDGVMTPLMVRPVEMTPFDDDTKEDYSVIAGSRRFKASVEAGLSSVPCQVIEATDLEAAIKSLKENKERKNLTEREMMMSVKMQYDLVGGDALDCDPHVCQACGNKFDTSRGLFYHSKKAHDFCPEESAQQVQTHHGAVRFIASTHYPDISMKSAAEKINNMLDAVELPDEYLILLTDSESRSREEKQKLAEMGIDPERKFNVSSAEFRFSSVIDLYTEVDSIDGLEADRRVLSAIGDVDFDQANGALSNEINRIRDSFLSDTEDVTSAKEMERVFEATVTDSEQRLRRMQDEVGMDTIGRINLSFEDQKFQRYHALAKQQQKIENNNEIVRQAYERYLDELAQKHNW
jgi:hypothetical protein